MTRFRVITQHAALLATLNRLVMFARWWRGSW